MRSSIEYLRLLQSLLPVGFAWNRDDGSTLTEFLYGQAEEFARVDERSNDLLVERNTLYTNELLSDHENDLGLPNECSQEDETITERRNTAHAKFISLGEQNPQYYIDIAAAMGWTITINEFSPFICGSSASGDMCGDSNVIFYWEVLIDLESRNTIFFESGQSQSGDLIQYVAGLDSLMCILNQYKPAHTQVIFNYTGAAFGMGFSTAFDLLFSGVSDSESYSSGAYGHSFGLGFDVFLGGEFGDGFGDSFRTPQ